MSLTNVLQACAAALIVVTALSIWRHDAWWVRMWDFPRAQIVFIGIFLLMAFFAFPPEKTLGQWIFGLLIASLALQGWRIYPYTPLAAPQSILSKSAEGDGVWSIMVSNVLMDNRHSASLLELVHQTNPDVFFAVETDQWWAEQLAPLEELYPYGVSHPLDNTYGLVLYSRLELVEPEIRHLFEDDVPSVHAQVKLRNGSLVHVHLLHPKPPVPTESLETTERDAEILRVGREIGQHDRPTVVAGDLNDVAWSHTTRLFQRISGLLDPRVGRGRYSTYHAKIPFVRWPLDHVFHSEHLELVALERLPAVGSDHFPILARLNLVPTAPLLQDAPDAQPGDFEEAEEKIEAAEPLAEAPLEEPLIPPPGGP